MRIRDAVVGVGQDPPEALTAFADAYAWRFPQVPDLAPYTASDAYGIVSAPTVVVVDGDGRVADVVESWDRDGVNRASSTLAALLHTEPVIVSEPGDGLPGVQARLNDAQRVVRVTAVRRREPSCSGR